jgi:hypothetical protein
MLSRAQVADAAVDAGHSAAIWSVGVGMAGFSVSDLENRAVAAPRIGR